MAQDNLEKFVTTFLRVCDAFQNESILCNVKEPLIAIAIAVIWGIYGAIYFVRNSKKRGKETILVSEPA